MSEKQIRDLDRRIAEAAAQVQRLRRLVERHRQSGTSADETELLIGEVEAYIAQLRAHRRTITGG